jgi:hypothetical protein
MASCGCAYWAWQRRSGRVVWMEVQRGGDCGSHETTPHPQCASGLAPPQHPAEGDHRQSTAMPARTKQDPLRCIEQGSVREAGGLGHAANKTISPPTAAAAATRPPCDGAPMSTGTRGDAEGDPVGPDAALLRRRKRVLPSSLSLTGEKVGKEGAAIRKACLSLLLAGRMSSRLPVMCCLLNQGR